MRIAILTLALGLLPSFAGAAEDWQKNCADGQCTLARTLSDDASGRSIATFLVALNFEMPDKVLMGVALPLGAALKPGVRLLQGETVIEVGYEVCFPDGCRAMTEVAATDFDEMAKNEEIELRFFPFGQEKPIALPIPLSGLSEATESARAEIMKAK